MEIIKKPWFNSLEPAEILDAFGDIQPRPIALLQLGVGLPLRTDSKLQNVP